MGTHLTPATILYRFTVLAVMACLLGVIVSLAAIAFVECVVWLNDVLLISPRTRIQVQNPLVLTIATVLVPAGGGLVVGVLLQHGSVEKRPLGPPDSIRAVQLRSELPDTRSGLVSTVAAAVSLGCGASVGQYGPMVYLGSLCGDVIAKLNLKIPNLQSIAIASGVAAAISTAFNAPIAGLIFAHEVILRHYSLQAFAPTTVAAATGYVVANVIFERPALFLVEFPRVVFSYEFGLFALLGVACAVLATGFMRLTLAMARVSTKLPVTALYRPAIAGLLVGLVALGLPDILGTGAELLRFATIEGAFTNSELALLVFSKIALTAVCVGFGFAGGVFSPVLLIGILFGALFWALLEMAGVANSGVAVYAICGMMALSSPVIGAPLTTILIVFELTHNYHLTVAAMVAVVFANLLAFRLFGRSLFDVQLMGKGVNLSSGRDRAMLENCKVVERLIANYEVFTASESVTEVLQSLVDGGYSEAAITDNEGRYLGMLRIQDMIGLPENTPLESLLFVGWPQFNESTSIWQAMRQIEGFVGGMLPVVSEDGRLMGMTTEADLIDAYFDIIHELRKEENAAV